MSQAGMSEVASSTLERLVEHLALVREAEALLERLLRNGSLTRFDAAGPYRTIALGVGSALGEGDVLFGTQREWPAGLATELPLGEAFKAFAGSGYVSSVEHHLALAPVGSGRYVAEAVGYALGLAPETDAMAVAVLGPVTFSLPEVFAALQLAQETKARVVFVVRGPKGQALPWTGQSLVTSGESAALVGASIAQARGLLAQGPVVVDARTDVQAPVDVFELQARGLLSPDKERELAAQIKLKLDAARLAASI